MFALLLLGQIAIAAPQRPESVYSSAALRDLVERAARANHAPPSEFRGYGAHVESELSFISRDTLGREGMAEIEQLASDVRWTVGGEYDIHVVGYRVANVGVPFSALSTVRGWTIPSLYGDRLQLGVNLAGGRAVYGEVRDSAGPVRGPEIIAVHPFSADRDVYYRFSGGDTISVLATPDRSIPVVRILVRPHLVDTMHVAAFEGEIDLDASRAEIVRMRGQFVELGGPRSGLVRLPGLVGVAYAEFVNAEFEGRYWLPVFQRTEFQAEFALFGPTRAVFRVVSRFSDHAIDTATVAGPVAPAPRAPARVTYAPPDSVNGFSAWRASLGEATSSVHADDFNDIGPDAWRPQGPPRIGFVPTKTDNVLRFDRVEGLYTGFETTAQFRDAAPGLSADAFGGWAWEEHTPRGGARISLQRSAWTVGARAERSLASTNDFVLPFDEAGGGLGALLGSIDDADYVDRRVAALTATRVLGSVDRGLVTLQLGTGDDRAEVARLTRGIIPGLTPFRPNRGVSPGSYALGVLDAEFHPDVNGDFAAPGVGARLHLEAGSGTLTWQRGELSLSARQYWGPIALSLHGDAGAVTGARIPPQTLFEIGGSIALPAYAYKEFAGDHAALVRSFATYTFPVWRTPRRVFGRWFIPGLAPGVAAGLETGWTEISSPAAQMAVDQLGAGWSTVPVSQATRGIRGSVGFGFTLMSGVVHAGIARPIDHPAPWRLVAGFGEAF